MTDLTAKQEAFALALVKGASQADAYRQAGYSAKTDKQVWENASRLSKNPKVQARVDELRAPVAKSAVLTLEGHLADLQRLRNLAVSKGQISAAIRAEEARGRASGLYERKEPIKVEDVTSPDRGPRMIVIGGHAMEPMFAAVAQAAADADAADEAEHAEQDGEA